MYGGYSLPPLHQMWSSQAADFGNNDQIVGVSDTSLLVTGTDGDTYLLATRSCRCRNTWLRGTATRSR